MCEGAVWFYKTLGPRPQTAPRVAVVSLRPPGECPASWSLYRKDGALGPCRAEQLKPGGFFLVVPPCWG